MALRRCPHDRLGLRAWTSRTGLAVVSHLPAARLLSWLTGHLAKRHWSGMQAPSRRVTALVDLQPGYDVVAAPHGGPSTVSLDVLVDRPVRPRQGC
jgi:hypothetical protein